MKLREGDTQHIGEVYQLLLGLAGKELLEAVIDPLRQGFCFDLRPPQKECVHWPPFLPCSSVGRGEVIRRP